MVWLDQKETRLLQQAGTKGDQTLLPRGKTLPAKMEASVAAAERDEVHEGTEAGRAKG